MQKALTQINDLYQKGYFGKDALSAKEADTSKAMAGGKEADLDAVAPKIVQPMDVPTDEKKADALARIGLTRPDAVFGNSVHDLAMLEAARNAFPVNPSPELLEAAAKNGWGYFLPEAAGGGK